MSLATFLRKLLAALGTWVFVSFLTFILIRVTPGGPFDGEQRLSPELQATLAQSYHLDEPLLQQWWRWLVPALRHGDLGQSLQYLGRPVTAIIADTLPLSLGLGLTALVLAATLGTLLGCLSAGQPKSWLASFAAALGLVALYFPPYLIAGCLILFFSLWLKLLPPALWETPTSWILPVITLSARPLGTTFRLTRGALQEVLAADFIRTATAKGLTPRTILFKHALGNAFLPLLTWLSPIAANLLTGSFLVETIFQLPGMGRYFIQAILNRDYPLVMGVTLCYGLLLIGLNLAVDCLQMTLDPRTRRRHPEAFFSKPHFTCAFSPKTGAHTSRSNNAAADPS